jgi:hypothetical protein
MTTTPKVLLKRSSIAGKIPTAGDLQYGELAINFEDGKLYYKDTSDTIRAFVDSARVQAIADAVEVTALAQLDSGEIITLIDSAYVQARQDYAYASLTGTPDIPSIVRANALDSAEAQGIIDSDFITRTTDELSEGSTNLYYTTARADSDAKNAISVTNTGGDGSVSYDPNTGIITYTGASAAEIRAHFSASGDLVYDSVTGQFSIDVEQVYSKANFDSDLADATTDGLPEGTTNLYYTTARADSDFDVRITTKSTTDIAEGNNLYYTTVRADSDFDARLATKSTDNLSEGVNQYYTTVRHNADTLLQVDSAYVQARQNIPAYLDSSAVESIIDSAYVQLKQDYAYASLTGAPTTLSAFGNDAGYITLSNVDSAYIQSKQDYAYASLTGAPDIPAIVRANSLDSVEAQNIIDSNFQNLSQDIIPAADATYDLGTLSNRFRDLYLSGSSLYIGNIKLTDSNGKLAFRDLSGNSVDVSTVDSAYVQLRQDYAYASLTGAPTNVSQFTNDAGYITTAQSTDSAEVISIIDSAHVQARQDYAYASLTGVPTNVSQFANDANYLDSNTVTGVIDATYVQSNQTPQDFAYASLTGAPTNVSAFTNDANYLDSNTSQAVINTNFAAKTTDDLTEGSTNQYYLKARVDSDISASLSDSGNTVTITINNTITDTVDSAYVQARIIDRTDSAWIQPIARKGLSGGTGVIYNNHTGDISIGQSVGTTDSVEFGNIDVSGNVVIGGNLQVQGTTFTANTASFSVDENLFYLNDLESAGSPTQYIDIGFAGNVNETGTYTHAGFFRDATDGVWKVFNAYSPEPDTAELNTAHASYTPAPFEASTLTGQYLGFDSDFGTKTTSNLTEGSNQYYTNARVTAHVDAAYVQARQTPQDFAYASLTGKPNILDSANVSSVITADVDQAFVNALNVNADTLDGQHGAYYLDYTNATNTPNVLDSVNVSNIITTDVNAAYVQARQDYAYASLTGTPNVLDSINVSSIISTDVNQAFVNALNVNADTLDGQQGTYYTNYANLTGAPNVLDSANVSSIITADVDATFVQALQDYAYSSLTGTPNVLDSSHVIAIHNSLGGVDSGAIIALIDSAYVQARQIDLQRDSGFITNIIDSAYIAARTSAGTDSATVVSIINSTVDSAYVQLRQSLVGGAGTDSATVSTIILADVDSAYVQARQLNEVAAPLTQVSYEFTATAGQSSFTGLDIDSGKFQTYLNGSLLAASDYTFNSTKVDLVVAADSGDILNVIKFSGNDTGATAIQQRHYIYTATSGQTIFTGADDNAATLSYTQGRVNVYLNGLLLIDSADYTQNVTGDTVTFTSGVTAGHIVNIQTLTGNTGSFAPLSQTLYEYTADSGQTVFTGVDDNSATLDFSNDKVVVYLNGILLTSTDYTLSGGNTVTLDTAADSGNHLTVAKLSGNNIGLDSGEVRNLIDSAYISALGFGSGGGGTDSATVVSIVNEYIDQTATNLTTTTVDQVVDTFAAATYRTAKYIVQMSHTSGYHSSEILLVHDGSTVYMTTYADIITNASLGTIDGDINAGNVRLLVSPVNTNTNINITRINVDV